MLRRWTVALATLWMAGAWLAADARPVYVALRPDPQPMASIREADNGPDAARILDPLSMRLLWRLEDLHRIEIAHEILTTTATYPTETHMSGYWTQAHLEDEPALLEALMRSRKAQYGDQFEQHAAADKARAPFEARSRKLREARRYLVQTRNFGMLDPFDFRHSAYPAQFHSRCQKGPDSAGNTPLCECSPVYSPADSRKHQRGCVLLTNVVAVRVGGRVMEVAPLRYLPFEDHAEARAFTEKVRGGAKPWFLVERRGDLMRAPGQQWRPDVFGHVPVVVTHLIFADRQGNVVKSFVVPEKPVTSAGLPLNAGAAIRSGKVPHTDLRNTAPQPKKNQSAPRPEDSKSKPITVTPQ